ncbi:MAG: hypothetical protein GWN81_26575, partial [Phycisphaerae bacterium]|nr:hypothetical protein [Phycisphaerae bacterium]NIU12323.1 hypothetical protein [Phycisphaerae bacterium]NIW97389.1 hypothetical protein [Phycisphaerae bacterium]NIX31639.1 hypothetical protein [Phycisphaerae bacterium]
VSNDYEPAYERQQMDLAYLVDEPLSRLKSFWDNKWDDRLDILVTSGEEAKEDIINLLNNEQSTPDSWGPIGGDFHPYNTHFDQQNSP